MLLRPVEESGLRLAGVRAAAAELGRPLSAFAIGAWRCPPDGHAWRSRSSSQANFSPPSGVAKFPDSGVDDVHLVHHDHFTA